MKSKEPIRLRKRTLSDGKVTLYLDIYINGKRKYEYLKLYLIPEITREDKRKNKETMLLAESVKSKRLVEWQQGRFDFAVHDSKVGDSHFTDYVQKYIDVIKTERAEATMSVYRSMLSHIRKYNSNTLLKHVDKEWLEGFYEYLCKHVNKTSSANIYMQKLTALFHYAISKDDIQKNPMNGIKMKKADVHERNYLTISELRKFGNAEPKEDEVKRAFMFCCLTGMRFSDVCALKWNQVREQDDGRYRIVFTQIKTKGMVYQDLHSDAVILMGEKGKPEETVFGMSAKALWRYNIRLRDMCESAGIDKYISFHCSRHTFALLLLDNSIDIYTVSKLLGHADVKTTQIYAHILDKKKQEAINSLPSIFNNKN